MANDYDWRGSQSVIPNAAESSKEPIVHLLDLHPIDNMRKLGCRLQEEEFLP